MYGPAVTVNDGAWIADPYRIIPTFFMNQRMLGPGSATIHAPCHNKIHIPMVSAASFTSFAKEEDGSFCSDDHRWDPVGVVSIFIPLQDVLTEYDAFLAHALHGIGCEHK